MLLASLFDHVLNIDLLAFPGVQLIQTQFDVGAEKRQTIDTFEEFATELLLRGFRQGGGFRQCEFESFDHAGLYHIAALR